jgi:hypothetical protein
MEEVLICSNKVLPSIMMMPLYGSQNGLNQDLSLYLLAANVYRRFRFSAYPMLLSRSYKQSYSSILCMGDENMVVYKV